MYSDCSNYKDITQSVISTSESVYIYININRYIYTSVYPEYKINTEMYFHEISSSVEKS